MAKKKNRKKQLRHKVRQESKRIEKSNRVERYGTTKLSADIILGDDMLRHKNIADRWNRSVDYYVEREAEKRQYSKNEETKKYLYSHPVSYIDYGAELRAMGINVSDDEIETIPDLGNLRTLVEAAKEEYEAVIAANNNYTDNTFKDIMQTIDGGYYTEEQLLSSRDSGVPSVTSYFLQNQGKKLSFGDIGHLVEAIRDYMVGSAIDAYHGSVLESFGSNF